MTPVRNPAAGIGAIVVAGAGVAALAVGTPGRDRWFPPCPFHALTGLDCPGCGTTRALDALVSGDLVRAFTFNPLAVAVAPVLAYLAVRWVLAAFGGRMLPTVALPARAVAWAPIVVMAFAVARNLPLAPVSWMGA